MESKGIDSATKRKRSTENEEENSVEMEQEQVIEEETETIAAGSEEMELNINRVLERIERFTQQVSGLLEAGKAMFKDVIGEFEERLITIHREQIEKWQDEIKELRSLDELNEQASNRLRNAQFLLQNVQMES